jgi:hypothetical protein
MPMNESSEILFTIWRSRPCERGAKKGAGSEVWSVSITSITYNGHRGPQAEGPMETVDFCGVDPCARDRVKKPAIARNIHEIGYRP